MKAKALAILTIMAFCLSFVTAVSLTVTGPVSSDTWYVNPSDSIPLTIESSSPRDIAPPSMQLAVLLDGSGSMDASEWNTEITGLYNAIIDPACMPEHSVELTVIQFAGDLPGGARTEVPPTVITNSNRNSIAADVLNIVHVEGITPIEAGIKLAVDELMGSPYFSTTPRQIINISSDV